MNTLAKATDLFGGSFELHPEVVGTGVLGLFLGSLVGVDIVIVIAVAELHAHHLKSLLGDFWLRLVTLFQSILKPVNSFHLLRGDVWRALHELHPELLLCSGVLELELVLGFGLNGFVRFQIL